MTTLQGVSIPKTQTAAVVPSVGGAIEIDTQAKVIQANELKSGQCLVKITHTGVCHTDLHAKQGDWPIPPMNPLIGGHEGVGHIVAIGANTVNSPVKLGDRVGIKWLANSCLTCEACRRGFEMNCDHAELSGYTVDGTFAEYVVSFVNHVTPIPPSLDSAGAASILCAGVTSYKALKVSNTKVGDWVALPGAGGGLGHLAVQYAKAMGLKVVAIDTGAAKEKLVKSLGADAWVDFKTTKDLVADVKAATGGQGPAAAIVTASHKTGYSQAIDYLKPSGTLVAVGLPNAEMGANVFWTVFKSIRIQGSYVGNRQDAIESLQLVEDGKVKVIFEQKPLADLKAVYEGLEEGKIAGRIVLQVAKE
ncbi:alcohol dehydrogenase, propanol-preferring [Cryptococcus neoformans]|uniref:alcohol dehydrogenase n=2 Tax=Cryptococcus neoformans TaxID=5207 RepID=A0A854QCZ6_CRYNE|nr:alcohol dehydrogenase, propanol-preferring [Cryptococcus neoformans var. grubii H99]AUB25140.1 alcohol dehydrogenase, propanol-preferring [Cryptococcus neoformans var. grubii]OWT39243.1 alcohol dehydrogenase, propanol-preferring [Cryptococcus neoformans var. grubii Bt1]OWZ31416.1 alcohol dehydrogenase, propanol-preferring [Cryptococcus neoformans var. grubii AD2-60a]OWZ42546.1 alcohol dehydrogenase, propanol-preferring [Cryptococcus neoformans var. grubii AD1-83a]OWZ43577.1 alcohol dehydrog|eukprot:XP_012050177.1 alcohol dehydrogenase, propanol-preferring [Cryptococcus neoformans var. grubii H99]